MTKSIADMLKFYKKRPANVLESLLAVQEALGFVPPDQIPEIARVLEVSDADVAGVLSYYPDLRVRPCARHHVRVCLGESCIANHADRVMAEFQRRLGVPVGASTADGRVTLDRVYCVGNCAVGPSVMLDGEVHGRITTSDVATLLDDTVRREA